MICRLSLSEVLIDECMRVYISACVCTDVQKKIGLLSKTLLYYEAEGVNDFDAVPELTVPDRAVS